MGAFCSSSGDSFNIEGELKWGKGCLRHLRPFAIARQGTRPNRKRIPATRPWLRTWIRQSGPIPKQSPAPCLQAEERHRGDGNIKCSRFVETVSGRCDAKRLVASSLTLTVPIFIVVITRKVAGTERCSGRFKKFSLGLTSTGVREDELEIESLAELEA